MPLISPLPDKRYIQPIKANHSYARSYQSVLRSKSGRQDESPETFQDNAVVAASGVRGRPAAAPPARSIKAVKKVERILNPGSGRVDQEVDLTDRWR